MSNPTNIYYTIAGTDYTFPFPYLSPAHVKLTIDGSAASYELIAPNTIRLNNSGNVGKTARIYRDTPKTPIHTWEDGAVILAQHMNAAHLQVIYIAEEGYGYAEDLFTSLDQSTAADLAAETAARIAGDAAEASARIAAVTAEANARVAAANLETAARIAGDAAERNARINEDIAIREVLASGFGSGSADRNVFGSKLAASATPIAAHIHSIRTLCYESLDDQGGGTYVRVAVEPSHAGKFQDASGAWWELSEAWPTVTQFGAKGDYDGTVGTDNAAAFLAALTYSRHIHVPRGTFYFAGYACYAAIANATVFGPGRMIYNNGTTTEAIGSVLRIGICDAGGNAGADSQGGVIVGADGGNGNGMRLRTQHNCWFDFKPTRVGAAAEVQIYTSGFFYLARSVAGTAFIDADNGVSAAGTYGNFANANIQAGDEIGFAEKMYRIKTKVSNTRLELETIAGGAVTFPSSVLDMFAHAYYYADGRCDTNGTSVTWRSKDYFFGIVARSGQYNIVINGTKYPIQSVQSERALTLATSAGTQTDVPFTIKALSLALNGPLFRLQTIAGGVEENLALYGTKTGVWRLDVQADIANGARYRPFQIRTGSNYDNPSGTERCHFEVGRAGQIHFGWDAHAAGPLNSDCKINVWRDPRLAPVLNGSHKVKMLTLATTFNAGTVRRLQFGNLNNYQAGYIQGWQDQNETLGGLVTINPFGGNVGINTGTTGAINAQLEVNGGIRAMPQASAPAAHNGVIYYDNATHKLRLYANGAWIDLNP